MVVYSHIQGGTATAWFEMASGFWAGITDAIGRQQ